MKQPTNEPTNQITTPAWVDPCKKKYQTMKLYETRGNQKHQNKL